MAPREKECSEACVRELNNLDSRHMEGLSTNCNEESRLKELRWRRTSLWYGLKIQVSADSFVSA